MSTIPKTLGVPREASASFLDWMRRSNDIFNAMPPFSVFSTSNGPEGVIEGNRGTFGVDVGSSCTTVFWGKTHSSSSTGWLSLT